MNDYNEKEEKKGGFWSSLSGLFRGGSSAMGGASSGLGSAGGMGGVGGLFATKAGIVGMVLGGATIAAGVGVVYNFIGPSSKPAYSPELFQNSYYEEESSKAGAERARARDTSAADASTLDMFREQAKKDGIGVGAGGGDAAKDGEAADASAAGPSADSGAPGAPGAEGASGGGSAGGVPKLQAAAGFGSKGGAGGGGSGTSIPRMQGNSGLSGGIGAQFASVYRAPANSGKVSGMTASAARVSNSPKYAVPNFNKRGAYGQAKFAGKMGAKAAYSADGAGSRTSATEAFTGETTGTGDASPAGGSGLGGAGISSSDKLKGNDPSLNSNESTVPKPGTPIKDNPYQKYEDMAMYGMLAGAVLLLIAKMLAKRALGLIGTPAYAAAKLASVVAAYAAMAAGALVLFAGLIIMSKYGQKMEGGLYMAAGAMIIYQAYQAIAGIDSAEKDWTKANTGTTTSTQATLDPKTGLPNGTTTTVTNSTANVNTGVTQSSTVTNISGNTTTTTNSSSLLSGGKTTVISQPDTLIKKTP